MSRYVRQLLAACLLLAGGAHAARELSPDELAAEKQRAEEARRATAEAEAAAQAEAEMAASLASRPAPDAALFETSGGAFGLPIPEAEQITNTLPRATKVPVGNPLVELARKVAPAVLSLRAWDGYGNELARGCGFFIGEQGALLTDMSVVHPDFAARLEYISITTGTGQTHRVSGVWAQNLETGFTVLQSDARDTPFLVVDPQFNFAREQTVSLVALHENHGLTLADAFIKADDTAAGAGWLNLRGEDSPGEPGSPVLSAEGKVVALVAMRVPQGKWFNFGIRIEAVADVLRKMPEGTPAPLGVLAKTQLPPVQQDQRFIEAFLALQQGRARTATAALVRLLKPYPRSAELWALLGLGFAQLGAKDEAANCNRKAVALDPTMGEAWRQLGVNQLAAAPVPAAREALEKAVVERPADRLAWQLLAEQQLLARQFAEAERSLLEVLKLESDYAQASYLLGYAKASQGDYRGAEEAVRHCLRQDKKHVAAWFYLGLLCARQGRLAEAAEAYRQAVALDPKHPNAWRNLALVQRQLGRTAEAGVAFERHRRLGTP
jgi:tetratricopeptide (TPR) repeat protein